MPMIDVRDTSLYYEVAGDGEPTLLFIHGMCGAAWNWEDQMERLSPHFTCVAYDRRGHSRSEPGTEDQSNRTHVDDAAALIEALDLDKPIVVGSSSGGAVTIELVQRYPDLVRGAVVSEPVLFRLKPGSQQELVEELGPVIQRALDRGGPREAVDAFFQIVCTQFWSQINEGKRDRLRDNAPLLFATMESQPATITTDELAGIDHPVLAVAGSDSSPIFRSIARSLVDHLPNGRYVEFEDIGHVTYAEKPTDFADAVIAFAHEIADPVAASSHS